MAISHASKKYLRSLEIGRSGLGGDGKPWPIGTGLYRDGKPPPIHHR
jgi:hypothetical protein